MKIVHVTPYMHPAAGGPPVVVDRLSRELCARGHDVQVVTTDLYADGDPSWIAASDRPYLMTVVPASSRSRCGYSRRLHDAIDHAVAAADVVHTHTLWTYASCAAMQICRRRRIPYLAMPHGMLDPQSVRRGWLKKQLYGRLVEWPLLQRAVGMCYTHPEEERLAAETCGALPPGHIVELGAAEAPSISREELRRRFLDRYPELLGRTVALFLGRLHSKKGLDLLIPAFERVHKANSQGHLLLVGPGDPDYVDGLRRQVSERDLASAVTFTGPLYDLDKWGAMAASDLFVLPSYQENFALTVVDALRSGLPVLLSRRVNIWQDVVDAGAARSCDTTVDSVAEELQRCLGDRDWAASAALAGPALLATRFNWSGTASQLERTYQAVASRGRPRELHLSPCAD